MTAITTNNSTSVKPRFRNMAFSSPDRIDTRPPTPYFTLSDFPARHARSHGHGLNSVACQRSAPMLPPRQFRFVVRRQLISIRHRPLDCRLETIQVSQTVLGPLKVVCMSIVSHINGHAIANAANTPPGCMLRGSAW